MYFVFVMINTTKQQQMQLFAKCNFLRGDNMMCENSKLFNCDVIITNKYYNYYDKQKQQIYEKYKNDKNVCEQMQHYNYLHYRFMLKNYKNKNCIFLIFNDNIVVVTFNNDNIIVHDFFMMYDAVCMIDEIKYKTKNEFFEKYIKNENVEKIIKTYCNL